MVCFILIFISNFNLDENTIQKKPLKHSPVKAISSPSKQYVSLAPLKEILKKGLPANKRIGILSKRIKLLEGILKEERLAFQEAFDEANPKPLSRSLRHSK